MSYVVTGATGHLGRLVVSELLERGVPAQKITAAGRSIEKIKDLADRGVRVQHIDFNDPATLTDAFRGAKRVLLVSGSETGHRVEQHRNAIDSATEANVELLAYTSIANADSSRMRLASEHQKTEALLRDSGAPYILLRHGWYLENYTPQIPMYLEHGAVFGSAGDGRLSAATRADYAAADAAALIGAYDSGTVLELGGDQPFTLGDLAGELTKESGLSVEYRDLPEDEYAQVLVGAGLPGPQAEMIADSDVGIARGELLVTSGDLSGLIGRPTTSMAEAVATALD